MYILIVISLLFFISTIPTSNLNIFVSWFGLCYRLHGNVESMAVLPLGVGDGSRMRDSIILAFRDAKISVLEFDDSIHGLRTRWEGC